jgi:hypothetical protein
MSQYFSYTRDNIPLRPPITKPLRPQIAHNTPLPFDGSQPQKMSAVEPGLRVDYPEEWWNIPRMNYPGESLAQQPPSPNREYYASPKPHSTAQTGTILIFLVIIGFILISTNL